MYKERKIMKCPNCNHSIPQDSKFCPDCGSPITQVKESTSINFDLCIDELNNLFILTKNN